MLYRILKLIVFVGIRLYYRKIHLVNRKHLETGGPCIFIANHPNTLMDAWLVGHINSKPLHFMAKATLFASPLRKRILGSLNMIPVNRRSDGNTSGVSNADSFEACYQVLEQGKSLLIFPEGSSYLERHLRELKTGAARIAFEAERRNAGKLGVKIIPIGLNYLKADRFRSDVVIKVGQPIEVAANLSDFEKNASEASRKLTEVFRVRLEQLLVNSEEREEEELTNELHHIFASKYLRNEAKGSESELELLKEIRDKLEAIHLTQPWKIQEIRTLKDQIKWKLERFEIRADFLDRRFRSRMFLRQLGFSLIGLLIGLPLFIYGLVHNLGQYKFTDWMVPRISKDPEYYAPLAVLIGLITYPLLYAAFTVAFAYMVSPDFWFKVGYFCSLPLSGLFSYYLYQYYKHVSFKWRFIFLMFKEKEELVALKREKELLREMIFDQAF